MAELMSATAQAVAAEQLAPFLARQPILMKDEKVMGYEVFFRESSADPRSQANPEPSAGNAVDTLKTIGLDVVCDGQLAFLHCTNQMLLEDALFALPANKVVAEIQMDIAVGPAVIAACERLKKSGYKIAIDNFWIGDDREQLVRLADFLKVDAGRRGAEYLSKITAAHAGKPRKMLAQNVDTRAQFKNAEKAGFTHFQGYFFQHPENMRVRQIPASQSSKLRLLRAISAPEIDFTLVETLIRHDASLCYRLMRYLNSPLLGFSTPVQSVRHAINLLGEQALTRWIRTATALSLGQPKCSDLVLSSLVRARFCELIGTRVERGTVDLFLVGMFSIMDAILETPLEVLIEGLAFDPHAKAVLLAIQNGGGTRLSPVCDLMIAREKGDWERVASHAAKLNLPLQFVNRSYLEALQWGHQMTKTASLHGTIAR
jgi:EAL and modified HD-GYP domain-containing signal transduction protein